MYHASAHAPSGTTTGVTTCTYQAYLKSIQLWLGEKVEQLVGPKRQCVLGCGGVESTAISPPTSRLYTLVKTDDPHTIESQANLKVLQVLIKHLRPID
jgi:hypothetical protein